MQFNVFMCLLRSRNAVFLSDDVILFKDLELYDARSDRSIMLRDEKQLAAHKMNGGTLEQLVLATDSFDMALDGGRGASLSGKMGGGFGDAGGGGDDMSGRMLFPATFNVGGRYRSYERVLSHFQREYARADHEYGVAVDTDGFVHRHVEGGRTSVNIHGDRGQTILHNHPSGGNFSKADMKVIGSGTERGVVAVGKDNTYSLIKTKRFDSKGFLKAVVRARCLSSMTTTRAPTGGCARTQRSLAISIREREPSINGRWEGWCTWAAEAVV